VVLSRETPQPCLLPGGKQPNFIALGNGILDVDALLSGRANVMKRHSPLWFSPVCLPYEFDGHADCPKWRAFLGRNLGDDAGKQQLLQQFAGYLLTLDTSQQHFLLLLGDGANGKSVVCAVLTAMLGRGNVSSVPLEVFGDRFRLTETLGKLANIAAEVGDLDKVAEGILKAYVTGDGIQFEKKFKEPFTARPTARLVLATNNPPRFSDKTDGLWRRMLMLKFIVQIPESERVKRMDSPEWWEAQGELPGILNWALAGLHQLRTAGRFTIPEASRQDAERMRAESNPARMFLDETYKEDPAGEVPCEVAYQSYVAWCKSNGYIPFADRGFGREVARRFPDMKRLQRTEGGRRLWHYVGVKNCGGEL
jgi:putative DNA primase/helicase